MKMILAIISDGVINDILNALAGTKYQSTKLSSTGGFRKRGNTTLLIGVDDEAVDSCIELLKQTVQNSQKREQDEGVADANIFVLPMNQLRRM